MAELNQVIRTIMLDLLNAREEAQLLSRDIGEKQRMDPLLSLMPVPGIRIDSVDLNLKFVVQTEEGVSDAEVVKKRQTAIAQLSSKAADALIAEMTSKKMLLNPPADLRKELQQQLQANINEKTLQLQSDPLAKALSGKLSPIMQNRVNPAASISNAISGLRQELSLSAANLPQPTTDRLLVDGASLSKFSNDQISSVSLKLSLDDFEWKATDSQQQLTPAR